MNGTMFCLEAGRLGYASILDRRMAGEVLEPMPAYVGAGDPARLRLVASFADEAARPPVSPHLSRRGRTFGSLPAQDEVAARRETRALRLPLWPPLNLAVAPHLTRSPAINLLLPGVRTASLSGGPNTALNIAYRLAAIGFPVRIFSTDVPTDADLRPLWDHIVRISGGSGRLPHMSIVDASDRTRPVEIGAKDIFFATAWWTAHMAYTARDLVGDRPFIYLIQDFEPILYPASTLYAASLATYAMPHLPVVRPPRCCATTSWSRASACSIRQGTRPIPWPSSRRSTVPISTRSPRASWPVPRLPRDPREGVAGCCSMPARPTASRNLFEIGVAALRAAVAEHILDASNWEIVGMGEAFEPVDLGGAWLACAPWLGFDAYAEQMRESDIILSLMLSPHPSYPPLEMAGCGGIAVTNTYGSRTAAKMAALSPNILAVEPTVPALVEALAEAVGRLDDRAARQAGATLALPATWDESFAAVIPQLAQLIRAQGVPSDAVGRLPTGEPLELGRPAPDAGSAYAAFLAEAEARRAAVNAGVPEPGLFCFVTTVWNTAAGLSGRARAQPAPPNRRPGLRVVHPRQRHNPRRHTRLPRAAGRPALLRPARARRSQPRHHRRHALLPGAGAGPLHPAAGFR